MLGYAWQKGWIPLEQASLLRAIELNAVAVESNKTAFAWGRRAALDWPGVQKLLNPGQVIAFTARSKEPLDALVRKRVEFLTAYQNAAYAERYRALVAKVQAAEEAIAPATLPLTEAVARYFFKLMAYKDEYEVARLHAHADFHAKLAAQFEGDFTLRYHMAPPLLAARNSVGELQKRPYGAWMGTAFGLLAPLKVVRGGPLDIFGYSEERRQERALVTEYRAAIEGLLPQLNASNCDAAVVFARVPEQIRGFGHVKARHLAAARVQWSQAIEQFQRAG